jgi:hypothetical protein
LASGRRVAAYKVYCHNSGVKRYCDAPAAIGGGHIGGVLVMRPLALTALAALGLGGCAQMAAREAATNALSCAAEVRASAEAKIVYARVWVGDDSDTADKLNDQKPLTKEERDALVQVHNRLQRCKQIIIAHVNQYEAWATPYWQELFQRNNAIFYKLVSGEISVGLANKLAIESTGKFQVDISIGHANAVSVEEARRQQAAQALLQASTQILASQPRPQTTTTNCSWLVNTLNCTSFR